MAKISQFYDCRRKHENTLQINMNDIQTHFNETVNKLLFFVNMVPDNRLHTYNNLFDEIYRNQLHDISNFKEHVTDGKYDKDALRALLKTDVILMRQINQFRSDLKCTIDM